MNNKRLSPDMATAEKIYPLILKRLEEFENFYDEQSGNIAERIFTSEYQTMKNYLSRLTGKDLSEVWLWEWWEGEGIEVLAFRLALPSPKKMADFTQEEVIEIVHILLNGRIDDYKNGSNFEREFSIYLDDYYHELLKINFPKTYNHRYFHRQKNGKEPTVDEIVMHIFR